MERTKKRRRETRAMTTAARIARLTSELDQITATHGWGMARTWSQLERLLAGIDEDKLNEIERHVKEMQMKLATRQWRWK